MLDIITRHVAIMQIEGCSRRASHWKPRLANSWCAADVATKNWSILYLLHTAWYTEASHRPTRRRRFTYSFRLEQLEPVSSTWNLACFHWFVIPRPAWILTMAKRKRFGTLIIISAAKLWPGILSKDHLTADPARNIEYWISTTVMTGRRIWGWWGNNTFQPLNSW